MEKSVETFEEATRFASQYCQRIARENPATLSGAATDLFNDAPKAIVDTAQLIVDGKITEADDIKNDIIERAQQLIRFA